MHFNKMNELNHSKCKLQTQRIIYDLQKIRTERELLLNKHSIFIKDCMFK